MTLPLCAEDGEQKKAAKPIRSPSSPLRYIRVNQIGKRFTSMPMTVGAVNWGMHHTIPQEFAHIQTRSKLAKAMGVGSATAYALLHPEAAAAHKIVQEAVRTGRLTPQPCEYCGLTKRPEAHHLDYSKPLTVMWLCRRCHRGAHDSRRDSHIGEWKIVYTENPKPWGYDEFL